MLEFSIYVLYRAGSALVTVLPFRLLFLLGEMLGFAAWIVLGRYRRLTQRNLAIAFSEKPPRELRRLSRRNFRRLGANLLCSVKLGGMPLEKVAECVALENAEEVHARLRAGQGVVLVLSHMGSWELFAQIFTTYFGYARISTVFQPLANRYIDADLRKQRSRSGPELFDRRKGFQKPIEFLRSGGVVAVLSDQHAGDQGLWTPFFGRLASSTPLAGLLAKRTGAAVIAAAAYSNGPGRWTMAFEPALNKKQDSVEAITAKANAEIAKQIRKAPEDWFWVHNRWKTPKPNFLLSHYKRGVYLPPDAIASVRAHAPSRQTANHDQKLRPEGGPSPHPDLKPFRILIRGTNWLGDSVISAAAVRAIKRGRPDAHLTVAAPANLVPVWRLIPEVDEVLALPTRSLFPTVRLLKQQQPFDAAILFPNSFRSALEVWLAGIPRRVGYRGHHRSWLLNQVVPDRVTSGPIEHQVNHYLHIASNVGAAIQTEPDQHIAARNGTIDKVKLGLCPGAEYGPAKRWLPERFAEVASAVAEQRSVQWILFGTASDLEVGRTIVTTLGDHCVNRIGETTLEELISELRECRLLLTNDTGTMHLATMLGVPVVAIFGSTEDRLTGPLGAENIVMRHHVECSPCFLRECPIDFRCMKAVTSEEVTAKVLSLLPL